MNPDKIRNMIMTAFVLFGTFFMLVGAVIGVYTNFIQLPNTVGTMSRVFPLVFIGFGLLFNALGWAELTSSRCTLDQMRSFVLAQAGPKALFGRSSFESWEQRESGTWLMGLILLIGGAAAAMALKAMEILMPCGMMGLILLAVSLVEIRLTMTARAVAVTTTIAGNVLSSKEILFNAIEKIKLAEDPNRNRALAMTMVSDQATLTFGQGGTKEELEWLQDRLLARTAQAGA